MDFSWATKSNTPKRSERKFGHLYFSGSGLSHGQVVLSEPSKSNFQKIGFLLSALLVSFSITSLLTTFAPSNYVELSDVAQTEVSEVLASSPEKNTPRDEAAALGLSGDFSLAIPTIKAYANIIENVDVASEETYKEALKSGVAHAQGTGFPGENKRIFLFAHSTNSLTNFTKYNAIFYDLRKLKAGDTIYMYYEGKKYVYIVSDKKVVAANDVSFLAPSEEPTMILQTCDPPGTTWKRLLVFATLSRVD